MFQQQFEILDNTVHYKIKYTGTEERASQSKFQLGKKSDKISVYNTVSCYSVNVQEVYSTGKCVKFYCDTIERFLDEKNNLKISFEISIV